MIMPFIPLEYNGPLCLPGSPCSTVSPWASAWLLASIAPVIFSGAATIFVALMLSIAGSRWRPFLSGALIALSIVYLSGLAIALAVSVSSNMVLGLPGIAIAASIGPLLVFLSGLLLARGPRKRRLTSDIPSSGTEK